VRADRLEVLEAGEAQALAGRSRDFR
jgi:hypothetical protein